jgi:hypothetical protein
MEPKQMRAQALTATTATAATAATEGGSFDGAPANPMAHSIEKARRRSLLFARE